MSSRIGVNETRSASAKSWPPLSTDTGSVLSLKSPACAVERFTYKAEGEPSRLCVLRPTNKRSIYHSSLLSSRTTSHSHSRAVFRSPHYRSTVESSLCHNCKKALANPNPNPSDSTQEHVISTRPSKRSDRPDDQQVETKTAKKRRSEEVDKTEHVKVKRLKHADELFLSAPKKKSEVTQELVPSASVVQVLPVKKHKEDVGAVCPKDLIKHQTSSTVYKLSVHEDSPRTTITTASAHDRHKSSHNKSRHRDRQTSLSKRVNGTQALCLIKEAGSSHAADLEKHESGKPPGSEPPIPPIKIKINRSLISADGGNDSDQSKGSDMLSEYRVSQFSLSDKVEVVHDIPDASISDSVLFSNRQNSPLSNKDPSTTEPPSSNSPPSEVIGPISPQHQDVPSGNERPVKRYRLPSDPSVTFRIDDVVWCKLSGWPWWPARIISLHRSASSCMACVRWVAWNQISHFPCEKIAPFLVEDDRKVDKRRMKKHTAYKKAIEEALSMARMRATQSLNDDVSDDDAFDNNSVAHEKSPSSTMKAACNESEIKTATPVNGFPLVFPSDESGSEFDGGGPLMIDHVPAPTKTALESEVAEPRVVFLPAAKQPCSILQ
ncbi:unnamed protein product [Taenia asiatica]|uniref:PWWP domain-containing protein n=1 Tax=Taenia asiatica TaxID=60517 RepID=A0A0R3W4I5_TAEAS|nr:unnamed protein product [Taenia asiatica]